MCQQRVVDLTVGCSFGCLYCPFSDLSIRRHALPRPTAVDLSGIDTFEPPPALFLSSASDAFAPQAAANTHVLLRAWLPRGTRVGIVTKGVIPERTLDLLSEFRSQVEGVAIGVTSLTAERNAVVEPGCPPAGARLRNIDRLAARGVMVALRLDPLFPELDDDPAALETLVGEGAARGATGLVATYVFAWGRYLRRMRREPLLAVACAELTERAPMEGGTAWSVPLSRKLATYGYLAALARARGMEFGTCGCKDVRLRGRAEFWGRCRMPEFAPPGPAATARD
jgi:DNA repair photolyase